MTETIDKSLICIHWTLKHPSFPLSLPLPPTPTPHTSFNVYNMQLQLLLNRQNLAPHNYAIRATVDLFI